MRNHPTGPVGRILSNLGKAGVYVYLFSNFCNRLFFTISVYNFSCGLLLFHTHHRRLLLSGLKLTLILPTYGR